MHQLKPKPLPSFPAALPSVYPWRVCLRDITADLLAGFLVNHCVDHQCTWASKNPAPDALGPPVIQGRAPSASGAATVGGGLSREETRLLIRAELKRAGISDKITRYALRVLSRKCFPRFGSVSRPIPPSRVENLILGRHSHLPNTEALKLDSLFTRRERQILIIPYRGRFRNLGFAAK